MALQRGQGSRCTGLWRRRTWPTLWGSLAEKCQYSSRNAHRTSLRSLWPTQSCPSESKPCILEGPPYPAQLPKDRPQLELPWSSQDTFPPGLLRPCLPTAFLQSLHAGQGELFSALLRELFTLCMQESLAGPPWVLLQSHLHFLERLSPEWESGTWVETKLILLGHV